MSYSGYSVYLQAHEDDWQFFIGEKGFSDCRDSSKRVVFITLTAGDAGKENGWWQARENAALSSVYVSAGCIDKPTKQYQVINGHNILKYTLAGGRVTQYFFRLPDGNKDGSGFPNTGSCSMQQLNQNGKRITCIDASNIFLSWTDLQSTVESIISSENPSPSTLVPWLSVAEPDNVVRNKGDHSDHHYASLLVCSNTSYNRTFYITYYTNAFVPNLQGADLINKMDAYFSYFVTSLQDWVVAGQTDQMAYRDISQEWIFWGPKSYNRTLAQGNKNDPLSSSYHLNNPHQKPLNSIHLTDQYLKLNEKDNIHNHRVSDDFDTSFKSTNSTTTPIKPSLNRSSSLDDLESEFYIVNK